MNWLILADKRITLHLLRLIGKFRQTLSLVLIYFFQYLFHDSSFPIVDVSFLIKTHDLFYPVMLTHFV